jgi:hypothetical protein
MWSVVNFGKYEGKTLPEIALNYPDYFVWAQREGVFRSRGIDLERQAQDVAFKASHILPPRSNPKMWEIQYAFDLEMDFLGCFVLKTDGPEKSGFVIVRREPCFNLFYLARLNRNKRDPCNQLLGHFRYLYFAGKSFLTRTDCEQFLDDEQCCLPIPKKILNRRGEEDKELKAMEEERAAMEERQRQEQREYRRKLREKYTKAELARMDEYTSR